jgi:predicted nuclease of predicted toxin-antitoxin system
MSKIKFLLDANLSPETAIFLRAHGYNVKSLIEEGMGAVDDEAVALIAEKERRIIVTFDLDFGEIYYFARDKKFGVIVLRIEDQRVESVNIILQRFLYFTKNKVLDKKLFIVREKEIRIIQ